ncbi:hypothetical protein [Streptomyces purpureus]|uniref:Uncharacterized protein n=1 Tax=Streptomyces purpureus TaxID=1951 RepID=A0A918H2J6_9ACTN|nr:hypothetical protein [Streptomyces purpureus]GGT30959.1 hypothetical protein GCM10014713_25450 [Streptomyces purpureus]
MKNELIAIIGWVLGVQGGLGAGGRIFGDGPWGLLHKWWDIPTPGYIALAVLGIALALYGETTKKRAAKA